MAPRTPFHVFDAEVLYTLFWAYCQSITVLSQSFSLCGIDALTVIHFSQDTIRSGQKNWCAGEYAFADPALPDLNFRTHRIQSPYAVTARASRLHNPLLTVFGGTCRGTEARQPTTSFPTITRRLDVRAVVPENGKERGRCSYRQKVTKESSICLVLLFEIPGIFLYDE